MNYIKEDISGLEKELTGIIHKTLGKMLDGLDIKEWIETQVHRWIKKSGKKMIDDRVYAYLEEAEIEVPNKYRYSGKITINDYIVKKITNFAHEKANDILKNLKITMEG